MDVLRYFFVAVVGNFVSEMSSQETISCNMGQAESCAIIFQRHYDEVYMEFESRNSNESTRTISNFCRSILKGNNITKCYEDNIKLCNEEASKYVKVQWRKTEEDATQFCNDSVCNNFQQLETCAERIYAEGINDGQVNKFCRTFNESLGCASIVLQDSCILDKQFYYSLIARPTKSYYVRACLAGCDTLDESVAAIQKCWYITRDRSIKDDCQKHITFTACLHEQGDICPEVGKIMPKYFRYDYHKVQCTTTTSTTTEASTTPTTTTPTTTITTPTTTITTPTTATTPTTTTTTPTTSITTPTTTTSTEILTAETTTDFTTLKTMTERTNGNKLMANSNSDKLNISKTNSENDMKDLIENCFQTYDVKNTTFHSDELDFNKCTLLISTVNCLYAGHNSTDDLFTLYRLLPPFSRNITDNGLFQQCIEIINSYNRYIVNVEASCGGRPKVRNPGCTGHSYGIFGCSSGAQSFRTHSVMYAILLIIVKVFIS